MYHILWELINAGRRNEREDVERAQLLAQRRISAHQYIPDIARVRSRYGSRFEELLERVVSDDPMRFGKRGFSMKLVYSTEQMREAYSHYCRTVIVRLEDENTFFGVVRILQEEIDLWFPRGEDVNFDTSDSGLAAWITRWRARWDYR